MSAAVWTLPDMDTDIEYEFAAHGITLSDAPTLDQAQREAQAALILRIAAAEDAELERMKAAMMKEIEFITGHYERAMEKHATRRATCLRAVESLATLSAAANGFGKKKSATTPWGTFGVEDRSATVQMVDPAALVQHLAATAPERVRVTAKLPLSIAREYLTESELAEMKMEPLWNDLKKTLTPDGALPPGVEAVPAARVPFAKPFTNTPLRIK